MTTCLGMGCLFDLQCVSFVKTYKTVCALLFLLVLRVEVGFDCINSRLLPIFLLLPFPLGVWASLSKRSFEFPIITFSIPLVVLRHSVNIFLQILIYSVL